MNDLFSRGPFRRSSCEEIEAVQKFFAKALLWKVRKIKLLNDNNEEKVLMLNASTLQQTYTLMVYKKKRTFFVYELTTSCWREMSINRRKW